MLGRAGSEKAKVGPMTPRSLLYDAANVILDLSLCSFLVYCFVFWAYQW